MVGIQRILCPIDFSEPSRHALEHAVASASSYGARITVFHVYRELPIADEAAAVPPIEPQKVVEQVRRFCGSVIVGGSPEIVVAEGNPAKEIARLAGEMPADLLVMGTHGRGGFERLFLGSVTEKVLRMTPCPVLAVPPSIERAVAGAGRYKTILCALDFGEASSRAVEYAISLARDADARLILVHVVEAGDQPREIAHFSVPEYLRYLEEDAMTRLNTALPAEARGSVTWEAKVASGKVSREILRIADETTTDLIVMGVHGSGASDRLGFGSVPHRVLLDAPCPVLTVRTR